MLFPWHTWTLFSERCAKPSECRVIWALTLSSVYRPFVNSKSWGTSNLLAWLISQYFSGNWTFFGNIRLCIARWKRLFEPWRELFVLGEFLQNKAEFGARHKGACSLLCEKGMWKESKLIFKFKQTYEGSPTPSLHTASWYLKLIHQLMHTSLNFIKF